MFPGFLAALKAALSSASARQAVRPLFESLEFRRLLSGGQLITSFGNGGLVTDNSFRFDAAGVAVLPGNKIAVAAQGGVIGFSELDEYDSTGVLDPNFGAKGRLGLNNAPSLFALAGAPGGKLVIVRNGAIDRLNSDGSPDKTFNSTGSVSIGSEVLTHVVVGTDGSIVGFGQPSGFSGQFGLPLIGVVQKFDANGSLAWTYNGPTNSAFSSVAIESNGEVLAIGSQGSPATPLVVFLNSGGTVDNSVTLQGGPLAANSGQLGSVSAITQLPNGTLILAGSGPKGGFLAGYAADGHNTFDVALSGVPADVQVTPGGRILVGGADSGGNFYLAQFNPDGTPDASFGAQGVTITPLPGAHSGFSGITHLAFLSNTDIVAAGGTVSPSEVALALYTGSGAASAEAPFGGAPAAVPGVIQAENFDTGGEGVGYHDTESVNLGGAYRPAEGVDIQPTADAGGGYNVGWIRSGESLNYTVNVAATGGYSFQFRLASPAQGGLIKVSIDGVSAVSVPIENTGGFQSYATVASTAFQLTGGSHVVRLTFTGSAYYLGNLNYFAAVAVPLPFGGTPAAVPGTIQAENYDLGIEGSAYHDLEPANLGGQYRPNDGVDIQTTADVGGGYNVGWTHAGEYLNYSINVASTGVYDVASRVASDGVGGTFGFLLDGAVVSPPIAVPDTGAWQSWTSVHTQFQLPAGAHVLRVQMLSNGPATGYTGNFNFFSFTASSLIVIPGANASARGDSSNVYPFDFGPQLSRYQQVYAASEFGPGKRTITALRFRPTDNAQPFSITDPNVRIDLSTTSAAPDGLSPVFDNNTGADDVIVHDGPLSLSSANSGPVNSPGAFDVVIPLSTPFLYDPAKGNLLLQVRNFAGSPGQFPLDAQNTSGDSISRLLASGPFDANGQPDSLGLITEFAFSPAPAI